MSKPVQEYCTYGAVKIDDQVLPIAKAAALLERKTIQEWISDLANEHASKVVSRKPIVRRKPKPRPD